MKSLRKITSVLLVVIMVFSVFAMVPMNVSAATGNTITVHSNIMEDVTYTYYDYNEQVTVNYYLNYDKRILEQQAVLTYDPAVLQLADTNTDETYAPVMTNGTMINAETAGEIIFASTTTKFYDFTENGVFFSATFDIIGTGDTTVDLDVQILTGTPATSLPQYSPDTEIPLVYESVIKNDPFEFSADATLTGEAPVTEVTLKFAAPSSIANSYNWNLGDNRDVVFYYGKSTTFAENTMVPMTATAEKYYTEDVGVSTILSGGSGWVVYEVTLTAEQVKAAEASKFAGFATSDGTNRTLLQSNGNVLKAGVDTYGTYNDTAVSLADVNGKTFVIKDASWGASSPISYLGYWITDYNTLRFAAPASVTKNSNWDDVEFYYTNGGTFDEATKLGMVNTLETTKVTEPGTQYLRAGNWYIYAVSVDGNTAAEIEAATNAGFSKPGATNKTGFSKNVFKAKVNEYDGVYLDEAKTVEEVDGLVFVVQAPATKTTLLTFYGEWQTEEEYTAGNDDLITIRFAAPIGVKGIDTWDTGVELYYGTTSKYRATDRIEMTDTGETMTVSVEDTTLDTLASGEWKIYEVQLNLEQVKAIDNSSAVGFIKKGAWNKTSINFYRSILRATKIEGETAYTGVKESIETFDGLTFLISGEYDAQYETSTYLGSWVE